MSPSGRNDDMLTVDLNTTQSTGGYSDDNESNYEWEDNLCILLEGGRFISIDINRFVEVRKMDKIFGPELDEEKTFFKMRVGMKPGTSWCKILDWEFGDYQKILNDVDVMHKLEHTITPNPTYISEMISNHRDLQIDKVIDNT